MFVQLDTDIAKQANPDCVELGHSARYCCEEKLNHHLSITEEPPRCHYILPTQNTETWILASHLDTVFDENEMPIHNYETITNTEDRLIALGYPSKKGKNRKARKMNKRPADKYKRYGKQLTDNLGIARQRCAELDRLCGLFEITVSGNQHHATL